VPAAERIYGPSDLCLSVSLHVAAAEDLEGGGGGEAQAKLQTIHRRGATCIVQHQSGSWGIHRAAPVAVKLKTASRSQSGFLV
jgi:hypothetical protein